MRIKTQFVTTMLLFGAVLVIIAVLAIVTNRRVEKAGEQERIASGIAQGAGELSYLANDYLIYREGQQLSRWRSKFASFSSQVAGLKVDRPEQQALALNIRANERRFKELFDSVISSSGATSSDPKAALDPAFFQVSWSRMAVQSQGLVSDASRLAQSLHQEIDRLRETTALLVYAMVCFLGVLLLTGYLLTYRRILRSIARLQKGAAVIGSGNLDFRIEEKGNDEIGDLSLAFNRMTADLKTVTASKADLELQVAERKRAEEALRESREDLARAQEVGQIGSWRLDVRRDVLTWSDENHRIFGVPKGTPLTYESFLDIVHPDDRPYVDTRWKEGLRGESYDIEHRIVVGARVKWVREKAYLEFDELGKLLGGFGITQDITERRQAEEALKESEQRVRAKLDAILLPEGDIGNLELGDMIDAAGIRSLMEEFYKLARIPMSIVDLHGKILVGVGWQMVCTKFHRVHPEAREHCIESDMQLTAGLASGEVRLYKCKNHMWDIATPIYIGEKHVGNVFSGQFFFEGEPLDYESFRDQARRYGFDEEQYIAAVEDVPRLSREAVDAGMSFFTKLTRMLSQLSYINIRLARLLSERDRLAESLRQSEQRLQRAQEIAHLGGWELDLMRNELTWSDEVYRIFGLAPQEFGATYEAFLERVHPDDRAAVDAAYAGSLQEKRDAYEIEHRVVRKTTGEIRFVHEKCEHFRDDDGGIIRSVGMVHDVTERRQAEEALQKAHAQLQAHARRLEEANRELEGFAYTVSHDLRAPLRAINGFAHMLADDYGACLDAEGRRRLEVVETNAVKMGQLIDDLLAFSRAGRTAMKLSMIDMNGLVADVVETLRTSDNGDKAFIDVSALPPAQGDPALIRQVMANLIDNALKFSGKNSDPQVEVGSLEKDGERVYFVKDNGVGFDMKYHDKLFGVFQRLVTEKEFEGTGVGLAIVQRIVARHGGRAWADAAPGEGATFFFTLKQPS